jgi:hypothetical protein
LFFSLYFYIIPDQLPSNLGHPPTEQLISEDNVNSAKTMATDQSTVILEDLPLPEHEDYEVTGDESFVTAQQSLSQVHETPTKSDAGDSKHRDLAERSESQQSINEDSVSSEHHSKCAILQGASYIDETF